MPPRTPRRIGVCFQIYMLPQQQPLAHWGTKP